MNEAIIKIWNDTVSPTDEVYIIGDVTFMTPQDAVNVLTRLNGTKYLVKGNHDNLEDPTVRAQYQWIKDYYELNLDLGGKHKQRIVMCHYAFRVWNKSHHGAWNLYGHSHSSLPPIGKQLDVGIDATLKIHEWFGDSFGVVPFAPISLDQIKQIMDSVEFVSVDHH